MLEDAVLAVWEFDREVDLGLATRCDLDRVEPPDMHVVIVHSTGEACRAALEALNRDRLGDITARFDLLRSGSPGSARRRQAGPAGRGLPGEDSAGIVAEAQAQNAPPATSCRRTTERSDGSTLLAALLDPDRIAAPYRAALQNGGIHPYVDVIVLGRSAQDSGIPR